MNDEVHDIIRDAVWAHMPFRKPTLKDAGLQADAVLRILKERSYVIVKPLRISDADAQHFGDGLDYPDGRDNIRTLQELGLPIEIVK